MEGVGGGAEVHVCNRIVLCTRNLITMELHIQDFTWNFVHGTTLTSQPIVCENNVLNGTPCNNNYGVGRLEHFLIKQIQSSFCGNKNAVFFFGILSGHIKLHN